MKVSTARWIIFGIICKIILIVLFIILFFFKKRNRANVECCLESDSVFINEPLKKDNDENFNCRSNEPKEFLEEKSVETGSLEDGGLEVKNDELVEETKISVIKSFESAAENDKEIKMSDSPVENEPYKKTSDENVENKGTGSEDLIDEESLTDDNDSGNFKINLKKEKEYFLKNKSESLNDRRDKKVDKSKEITAEPDEIGGVKNETDSVNKECIATRKVSGCEHSNSAKSQRIDKKPSFNAEAAASSLNSVETEQHVPRIKPRTCSLNSENSEKGISQVDFSVADSKMKNVKHLENRIWKSETIEAKKNQAHLMKIKREQQKEKTKVENSRMGVILKEDNDKAANSMSYEQNTRNIANEAILEGKNNQEKTLFEAPEKKESKKFNNLSHNQTKFSKKHLKNKNRNYSYNQQHNPNFPNQTVDEKKHF